MNLNTSTNLRSLPPPGFVFRGQAGLAPNEFFGFGGTQTLVPDNPGNNIPIHNEQMKISCLTKCRQANLEREALRICTNNCR